LDKKRGEEIGPVVVFFGFKKENWNRRLEEENEKQGEEEEEEEVRSSR